MDNQVDWSAAPEGAEFARVTVGHVDFYKTIAGVFSYLSKDGKWHPAVTQRGDRDLIARPAAPAWAGEGLPPVGTVCELKVIQGIFGEGEWGTAEIVYSSKTAVVWRWQGATHEFGADFLDVKCRPLRTPEQIVTEERKKAVHQMGLDAGFGGSVQQCYERLYDAGYRKDPRTADLLRALKDIATASEQSTVIGLKQLAASTLAAVEGGAA